MSGSAKAFDAEAYVRAAAPAMGVPLAPDECVQVAAQLQRIRTFAELVMQVDLGSHDELAPKFEP